MKMQIDEAKEILNENDYILESDNFVKDFTDNVVKPLDKLITGLHAGEIDDNQLINDLYDIQDKVKETRNLLIAFKANLNVFN